MNRFFRHPATNALGISVFTLFYSVIFLSFTDHTRSEAEAGASPFWAAWNAFLHAGGHQYIAAVLIVLTVAIVVILCIKHKPYDEYHTTILVKCLAVSVLLTLAAIAVFYVVVLLDPAGFMDKFTLFITVNWSTVVMADLVYLLLCNKK